MVCILATRANKNEEFGDPVRLLVLDSPAGFRNFFVSPDGLTLYYGPDDFDLYMAAARPRGRFFRFDRSVGHQHAAA